MNRLLYVFVLAFGVAFTGCSPKDHRHESMEKDLAQLNNKVVAVESNAKSDRERLAETRGDVRKLYLEIGRLSERIGALSATSATPSVSDSGGIANGYDELSEDIRRLKTAVQSVHVRLAGAEESIRQIERSLKEPVLPGCIAFNDFECKEPCRCIAFAKGGYPDVCANCRHTRNQHTRFHTVK